MIIDSFLFNDEKELLELLAEINDSLSENDFGFKIKYNDFSNIFGEKCLIQKM